MAYITLNKKYFFNNLDIISKQAKGKDKIALVLKDNAYGHGLVQIATMAKQYGIKKAVVRCEVEAQTIKDFFDYILVLNDFPTTKEQKIRYTINDIDAIQYFPKNTTVELKIDTGMHRNGILPNQLDDALKKIQKQQLVLKGVFTHHRDADILSSEWFWQRDNFAKIKQKIISLGYNVEFHSSNSASLFRDKNFDEDMARVGIAAYGCLEVSKPLKIEGLMPILSLYGSKISSRKLKKGECIGYGATFEAKKDMVVTNYDFGYGDGFLRGCSNNYKTPDGSKLIGTISMDNSSFIYDKDEILIFNDATKIAKSANTISYEILTSLKHYIKREIV